jgi:hypothetical protein
MERIGLRGGGIGLRAGDVKVDHHWFLSAADDDSFYGLVFPGVKSLVRDVGRDIHEIAGAGFVDEFEAGAPAEAGASAHDVDYRLDFAVVVRASFGVGMDDHRAGPKFLCADASMGDGFGAGHAGSLRRVGVEVVGANDAQAVGFPVGRAGEWSAGHW